MAVCVTDRPFSGVRQIKYEQLLETNPEWVAEVSNKELEEYLYDLERRYQTRCCQLVEEGWEKMVSENPTVTGSAEAWSLGERLAERAREIALQEMLDA